MVELRKRKAPIIEPTEPPPLKKSGLATSKLKASTPENKPPAVLGPTRGAKIAIGNSVDLNGFGGEIETNDGEKTTLKKLIDDSRFGVVLFTYPKASTPGCTTQACLFRDDFTSLTATGYSMFGLSGDSPKSNTIFKTKQNLPYKLLCDPSATLISAIGMKKAPKGTTRGVVVINKEAKFEVIFRGGPAATVDEVRKFIGGSSTTEADENLGDLAEGQKGGNGMDDAGQNESKHEDAGESAAANGDKAKAEVAAEVADSAQTLDQDV